MTPNFNAYVPRKGEPLQDTVSAFIEAAGNGDLVAVAAFLDIYGNDYIDRRDYDDDTALINAAWQGREEVVSLLLARGADVHKSNHEGYTALMWAEKNSFTGIVVLLRQEEAARLVRKGIPQEMQVARPLCFRKKREARHHAG